MQFSKSLSERLIKKRSHPLLKKCFKYGYSKKCDTLSQLLQHADNQLFASLTKPTHCAHYLLPPIKPMFALFNLVAITKLCPNANIANTKIRLFAACIVRLILKLRGLYVNFV